VTSPHTVSADAGMPSVPVVAAYTARLGLSTYALAGLITLARPPLTPLHPGGYFSGYPGLVEVLSALCGLTWLAHRNTRRRATRTGAALLLAAALAHAASLTVPSATPGGPDLAAAGCTLILLGAVAGCALVGARRPTPLAAGKRARECQRQGQRRSVRVGLWAATYAVFVPSFWASLDTALPQPWVTLMLSICLWSADLNSHGGLTTHRPARQRAAAVLGAVLLPTALIHVRLVHAQVVQVQLGHGLAAEASGHPVVARLAAVATLAFTLVLAAVCWWLSCGHIDGRVTHDATGSAPTRRQHGQIGPTAESPQVAGLSWPQHSPRRATPEQIDPPDPAGDPDSSNGPAGADAAVTGTETTRKRSRQPETANARPGRAI
jgi:hypothetical protein